ncbi:hypothetical protein SSPO_057490 [Streptomyces antimycoticus]|uniref:Uncharacterized protein n=1 Tax=Streptomyces antimycoticus TaxID=68175 RepID=A0A499V0G4_9ACTN|nr:hypothetical protein SSPO_057490 [Streptomyces antimycoticus]
MSPGQGIGQGVGHGDFGRVVARCPPAPHGEGRCDRMTQDRPSHRGAMRLSTALRGATVPAAAPLVWPARSVCGIRAVDARRARMRMRVRVRPSVNVSHV